MSERLETKRCIKVLSEYSSFPFLFIIHPFVIDGLISVGYLQEEGCTASYRMFLKEMKHLAEYRTFLDAGYEYPTSICGKTLKMMLNEYGHMILSRMYLYLLCYLIGSLHKSCRICIRDVKLCH